MNKVCGLLDLMDIKAGDTDGGLRTRKIFKSGSPEKPLVTYITVCYNRESTLERCIKSVISQTYDNIEYIIIDGQSQDNTLDIIKKYESMIDYYISQKDGGIYDAMNKGVKLAKGDLICFINSDDYLLPEAAQIVVDELKRTGSSFICGRRRLYEGEKKIKEVCYPRFNVRKPVFRYLQTFHQACYVSPKVFDDIGPFQSDKYKLLSDWIWQAKAITKGYKVNYIDEEICVFTYGGASNQYVKERDDEWVEWACEEFPYLEKKHAKWFINIMDRGRNTLYDLRSVNKLAKKYANEKEFLNAYYSSAAQACVELCCDIEDIYNSSGDIAKKGDTYLKLLDIKNLLSKAINELYDNKEIEWEDCVKLEVIKNNINKMYFVAFKGNKANIRNKDYYIRHAMYCFCKIMAYNVATSALCYPIERKIWVCLFRGKKLQR